MTENKKSVPLKAWSQARYRIEVEGVADKNCMDRVTGMDISYRTRPDSSTVTCLVGIVMDQSELTGIMNSLAELHLPILKVENLQNGDSDA